MTGEIGGLDRAEEALQTAFKGVSGVLASFGFDKIDIPEFGKTVEKSGLYKPRSREIALDGLLRLFEGEKDWDFGKIAASIIREGTEVNEVTLEKARTRVPNIKFEFFRKLAACCPEGNKAKVETAVNVLLEKEGSENMRSFLNRLKAKYGERMVDEARRAMNLNRRHVIAAGEVMAEEKEPLERKKERALEIQAASCLHREGTLSLIEGLLEGTIENYAGRFSLAQPEEKYLDLLNASWKAAADKRNHSPIAKDEKKLFGDVVGRILRGEKILVNKNDPDQVNFTLLVSLINYFRRFSPKHLDDLKQIFFPCLSIRVDLASGLVVGTEKD